MHPQRQLDARRSNLAERERRQSQGNTSKIRFSDDFSIEKSAKAKNVARTGPNSFYGRSEALPPPMRRERRFTMWPLLGVACARLGSPRDTGYTWYLGSRLSLGRYCSISDTRGLSSTPRALKSTV